MIAAWLLLHLLLLLKRQPIDDDDESVVFKWNWIEMKWKQWIYSLTNTLRHHDFFSIHNLIRVKKIQINAFNDDTIDLILAENTIETKINLMLQSHFSTIFGLRSFAWKMIV